MKSKLIFTIVLFGITISCFGQQNTIWEKWDWLMGEWQGEGDGQTGQGGGTFSFSFDLDKKIIVRKSHSEYPENENKPKIVHDDLMIIYIDMAENHARAIYFDNEGHVINYSVKYTEKTVVLLSDKIENAPVFRLTYTSIDNKTIDTKFEISQDGENFITYVSGKSKKQDSSVANKAI
jgi:outer membrane lipoprotein-sorting protein